MGTSFGPNTTRTCTVCNDGDARFKLLDLNRASVPDGIVLCADCLDVMRHRYEDWHVELLDSVFPLCDLCSTPHPDAELWVLHAEPYEVTGFNGVTHGMSSDWAVCAGCRPFVDGRDLDGLVLHVVDVYQTHNPSTSPLAAMVMVAELTGLWTPLWETMRTPCDPPGSPSDDRIDP